MLLWLIKGIGSNLSNIDIRNTFYALCLFLINISYNIIFQTYSNIHYNFFVMHTWLNGVYFITSLFYSNVFNSGYDIDLYSFIICVLKGAFNVLNTFTYWYYGLHQISSNSLGVGIITAKLIREFFYTFEDLIVEESSFLLNFFFIVSVLVELYFKKSTKEEFINGFLWLTIPRTLTTLTDVIFQNIPSRKNEINNIIIGSTAFIINLGMVIYNRMYNQSIFKSNEIKNDLISFTNPVNMILSWLKSESRLITTMLFQLIGQQKVLALELLTHSSSLFISGKISAALSIFSEVVSILIRIFVRDIQKLNSGIIYSEIFKTGYMFMAILLTTLIFNRAIVRRWRLISGFINLMRLFGIFWS